MVITTKPPDRNCPSRVRFAYSGALRVTAPNSTNRLVNGRAISSCVYHSTKTHIELIQTDATDLRVESVPLSSLSVGELQEIVAWAELDTSAQTHGGLVRAIERYLG